MSDLRGTMCGIDTKRLCLDYQRAAAYALSSENRERSSVRHEQCRLCRAVLATADRNERRRVLTGCLVVPLSETEPHRIRAVAGHDQDIGYRG